MSSANPDHCPICGDLSIPSTSSKLGSGTSIFQCFLNLFQAKWKKKTFSFCVPCRNHLLLISDLQNKVQELENQIKSHEKELKTKFAISEVKFEKNQLNEKDGRYSSFRKLIRTKLSSSEAESILPDHADDYQGKPPQLSQSFHVRVIKMEMEDDPLSDPFDGGVDIKEEIVSEDDKSDEQEEEVMEEDVKPPRESSSSSSSASEQEEETSDDDYNPSHSVQGQQPKQKPKPDIISSFNVSADGDIITFHNITLFKTASTSPGEPFGYRCSDCGLVLRNHRQLLRSHVIREHTTLHACPHCPKRFDRESKVTRHVNEFHKKLVMQTCPICDRPFKFSAPIDYHIWSHYSVEEKKEVEANGGRIPTPRKNLECGRCKEVFPGIKALNQHIKEAHSNQNSLCGVCGKEVRNLRAHMSSSHNKAPEELKFECPLCKKKFCIGSRLKRHLRQAHGNGNHEWKCKACGKEFKYEKYLKEHILVHGDVKPFSCHICGMGFTKKSVMVRHISNIHEGKPRTDNGRKRHGRVVKS